MKTLEVKRRENESPNSLIYRFTKKVRQSGVLKEAKRRRFRSRPVSRRSRRVSALRRTVKQKAFERTKKFGSA